MKTLFLSLALALGAPAQAAAPGSFFDGAGAPPAAPDASALRNRRFAPPAPPPDLAQAAARWANAVQARKVRSVAPSQPVRLAVIGDAEPGRFPWQRIFAPKDGQERILRLAHAASPDAIVQLGDFVSKGTVPNYRKHVALLDSAVTLPLLSVVGNHDRSQPNGPADKTLYGAVFGPGDFFTDAGDWRLILLDSADRRVGAGQLAWLEGALAGGKRNLIFTHVPPAFLAGKLVSPKLSGLDQEKKVEAFEGFFTEGSRAFGELAARYRVERVYLGHIHALATARHLGVPYVLTGSGGSPHYPLPPGFPQEKATHFIRVELDRAGVRDTIHTLDGRTVALDP
ncbi:MAG: metallophosphoesterase [Elusimicrobia bacterium]|nr:metallophosphoesterase [Elusimicrobiota bacterium]